MSDLQMKPENDIYEPNQDNLFPTPEKAISLQPLGNNHSH